MLNIYGMEDLIDGCAYLVFFNTLYKYTGHSLDGRMVFRNTNDFEKTLIISYDELIKQRDLFEIAY